MLIYDDRSAVMVIDPVSKRQYSCENRREGLLITLLVRRSAVTPDCDCLVIGLERAICRNRRYFFERIACEWRRPFTAVKVRASTLPTLPRRLRLSPQAVTSRRSSRHLGRRLPTMLMARPR